MIKINLYDYREELKRIAIQKRVLKSTSIVVAACFLILFSWLLEKSQINSLDMEIKDLQQQVNAIQGTVSLVKSMQSKQQRVASILSGIESLRIDQFPATQILFDVNMGLPQAVWLTNIIQKDRSELAKVKVPTILFNDASNKPAAKASKKARSKSPQKSSKNFLEISGYALEDQSVARLVERLEEIPYFKMVFLYRTERHQIGSTKVQKFTIYCYMPANPHKTVA